MASRSNKIQHVLGGGLASDFGTRAQVAVEGGVATIPFLLEAKDIVYTLDGGFRKLGGTQRFATLGAPVTALHDYWYSSLGTNLQKRIALAGGILFADAADDNYQQIATGYGETTRLNFAQFDDDLIICSSDKEKMPVVYDGSTAEDVGTNTPNGRFSVVHKNRLWMAGDPSAPSTVFFSETLPNGPRGDWNSGDAGSIQINPGDGDEIRCMVSYKDNLFIFKGPHKGSIHRIEGTSPTGSDPFARRDFLVKGLPAISPNATFLYQDDLAFMTADGDIHGLKATAAYGDFGAAALTAQISTLLRDRISRQHLWKAESVNWPGRGIALTVVPADGESYPNIILAMDYRFGTPRWAIWEDYDCCSMAQIVDSQKDNALTVFLGGYDKGIRRIDQPDYANRNPTGLGYAAMTGRVTTPWISYGGAQSRFTLESASIYAKPDGYSTVTFGWSRDGKKQQTETLSAQGGDLLGTTFILGSSILGYNEARVRHVRTETGGEFNQIQYEISNGSLDDATDPATGHSMTINGFEVMISGGVESLEN